VAAGSVQNSGGGGRGVTGRGERKCPAAINKACNGKGCSVGQCVLGVRVVQRNPRKLGEQRCVGMCMGTGM